MNKNNLTGYPSIDKPWLKYYSDEAINAPLPECTLYENIYNNNHSHPDDIAIEYFGNKITYKELFSNVENVKNAFLKSGVKKGDKVIMYTSSTPELIYIVLALCKIGATANMLNPLFENEQVVERTNETGAEIMIALDELYCKLSDDISKTCIKTVIILPVYNSMPKITKNIVKMKKWHKTSYTSSVIRWNDFLKAGKNATSKNDEPYEKDRALVIVYSSGSTGASKGIVLTNDGINATIHNYIHSDFSYRRGDKFLQMIPVWFSTGIVLSVFMPICLGVTAILEPVFSKETFAKDIKKYKPNMTLSATSLWIYAATCDELRKADLSFLTCPITGGEQVIPRVEQQINAFFKQHNCHSHLLKGYGMCELGSTISSETNSVKKTGSAGFPIANVAVSAFDTTTNEEKKYGERGEIRVISPARMKEYYDNSEATNKYFYKDSGGNVWGCTGDVGYVDKDGFVYILGRMTDCYISKNRNEIYCFDIENVILENENVAQCEVVGLFDGNFEVPVAHIVLEENSKISESEIIKSLHNNCKLKLKDDEIPCGYKFCKTFPVKNNGKRDMELIKQDRTNFLTLENDELVTISFI